MQLRDSTFDRLYCSPLTRARQTAEIVWEGRQPTEGGWRELPVLREIDLYSFQASLEVWVSSFQKTRLESLPSVLSVTNYTCNAVS